MCNKYQNAGRYTAQEIITVFQLTGSLLLPEKPTTFPMYQGLFIRPRVDGPGREAALGQWGLVPHWAPDMKFGRGKNNARADTIASKPTFREAYKKRRCIIPGVNFFEPWQKMWYAFTLPEQPLFAFAGLWESWGPKDNPQESYTMVTTEANSLVSQYHESARMPVILDPEHYDLWMTGDPKVVAKLMTTYPAEKMVVNPIEPLTSRKKKTDDNNE